MNTEKTKGTGSSRTPFIRQLIRLTESAVLVALAIGLSYLELDIGLQGGSLSLVMIPLVILALRHGAGWGVGAGLVFGVIKCALGGGFAWGLASVLLDYVLAYGIIGVAGFFRVKSAGMAACAAVVAGVLRFVIHFISGVTIYKLMEATTLYGSLNPINNVYLCHLNSSFDIFKNCKGRMSMGNVNGKKKAPPKRRLPLF